MGKVKFKKLKSLRHNPVDLPSAEDLSKVEIADDSLQDQSAPVLSKVKKWFFHALSVESGVTICLLLRIGFNATPHLRQHRYFLLGIRSLLNSHCVSALFY